MIEVRTWDHQYAALQVQQRRTASLCGNLKAEKGKNIGFSQEQYDAAFKTLELAIQLFSSTLTSEQLETSKQEIILSRISLKCMFEDMEQRGEAPDANRYRAITDAAAEQLKKVEEALKGKSPERSFQLAVPLEAPSYWCQIL